MKKRPDRRLRGAAALLLATATGAAGAADLPAALTEGWYRVEVLVFIRDDALAQETEQWEPLPDLAYVPGYRYLVEPDRADRRLEESGAYTSRIDERGVQYLVVPSPPEGFDASPRPDALINEPFVDPEAEVFDAEGEPGLPALEAPPLLAAPPQPEPEPEDAERPTTESVPLVRPELALDPRELEFRAQAATLRRRGQRLLFHEAWWTRLEEDGPRQTIVVDRTADPDVTSWPELQGSISLYRSRYLHAQVNLWVNTMAPYLPEGWQIDAPALATPSLAAQTPRGIERDPWAPEPVFELPPLLPIGKIEEAGAASVIDPVIEAGPAEAAEPSYPWRHAIRHVQERRMRSGEVHYLDHPVLGVIVQLRPAGAGLLPIADDEDLAFRERHGLPVETVELPLDWATGVVPASP